MRDILKLKELLERHRPHSVKHTGDRIACFVEAEAKHLEGARTNPLGAPAEDLAFLLVRYRLADGRTSKKKGAMVSQSTAAASR